MWPFQVSGFRILFQKECETPPQPFHPIQMAENLTNLEEQTDITDNPFKSKITRDIRH